MVGEEDQEGQKRPEEEGVRADMAAGEKIQWVGNKGHGGVLELGKLGTRVPEISRDAASNPGLTSGFSGGHDGRPCDIAPAFCWVTDSDDKPGLGRTRRLHPKAKSRALCPRGQWAKDGDALLQSKHRAASVCILSLHGPLRDVWVATRGALL